jgi:LDH2 family malate/lactate/ureidoglycolate dehydrogenase
MTAGPVAGAAPRTIPAARLRGLVERILEAAGADDAAAELVASSLVASDLRAVDSHGVIRVGEYVRAIRAGRIRPTARPRIVRDAGALFALDGGGAFGQVGARELALAAAERAGLHGVALGTLVGVAHVGRLGEWVELAAAEGCIALAWCNCGDAGGNVVPYGGRASRLGTNPIAYAVPTSGGGPVVADFSTSVVAEGKVRLYLHAGRPVPDGWIVDQAGDATTDPAELYRGGAILPMGGHKGFSLALLAEILGGVFAGAGCVSLGDSPGNGVVLLAIDASAGADGDLANRVGTLLDAIRSSPPAGDGAGVVIPGEPERAAADRREREGIPVSAGAWTALAECAESLGVELPEGGGGAVV